MKDFRFSDLMNIAAAGFGPRSSENAVPNAGKGLLFHFAKEAMEDELDILLQKQREAEALADKVLPLIKEQKERCSAALEKLSDRQVSVMDMRASLYSMKNASEAWIGEEEARIQGLNAELINVQNEASEAYAYLQQKIDEANRKRAKLEKWCWVPFYNLALLSDFESARKNTNARIDKLNCRMREIREEMDMLCRNMDEAGKGKAAFGCLSSIMERELSELSDRIDVLNRMVCLWNQFYRFFAALKADITARDDIDGLMEEAKIQMRYAADAEKNINYDKFSVPAFESGQYLIRTFDGSYDMLLDENQNNSPVLFPHSSSLPHNPDAVMAADSSSVLVCFLDGSAIVLGGRHLALTRTGENSLSFCPLDIFEVQEKEEGGESGMSGFRVSENQKFCIREYPGGEGLYELSFFKDQSLCLDVTSGNFRPGTRIQLWKENGTNSQKFRIER